jgi:uncharacterized membrane protein
MIIWAMLVGAIIGGALVDYGDLGTYLGAAIGLGAGFALRFFVRAEIAKSNEKLRKEMQAWFKAQAGTQPAIADAAQATVAEAAAGAAATATPERPTPPGPQDPFDFMSFPEPPPIPSSRTSAGRTETASAPTIAAAPMAAEAGPAGPGPIERSQHIEPAGPAEPNPAEVAYAAARNWLLGGNTIVRIGLVILFIGLSFLASYAASAGLFPVEWRLALIAAVGIALLVIGFRKRETKPAFALVLQGGGVAVIYLTVFAASRLYDLLLLATPGFTMLPAFGLMLVVCVLSCVLALMQDSRSLAVAAFAGGFATPLLLSTGEGSSVVLFSYFTMLNLAILFIAYKRSWRVLNIVGFIATFGVATLWGVLKYDPGQYASSQLFLIIFVLIYLLAAIMYARNTPSRFGNTVDSTLMFGTALAGFGLQAGLVQQFELGTAFSALGFAAVYLGLAAVLMRKNSRSRSNGNDAAGNYRLMIECMLVIGVGFITLAVPLALDAHWTSGVWALEGAGAFWIGSRQARWMPRLFGLVLQIVAAFAFLGSLDGTVAALPLLNPMFIGAMLIALPMFAIAWWLRKPLPHSDSRFARLYTEGEVHLSSPVYLLGFVFWCLALVLEICRYLPAQDTSQLPTAVFEIGTRELLSMLALVASAWLSSLLGRKTGWKIAELPGRFTLLVMALVLLLQETLDERVLYTPAWAIWLVTLILHYRLLYQNDAALREQNGASASESASASTSASRSSPWLLRATHVGSVWLKTLLLADCLMFGIGRGDLWQTSWASVVLLISAVVVLLFLAIWAGKASRQADLQRFKWPRNPHATAYYWYAALPLAAVVFVGALAMALLSSGHTEPLPYIPLLNPTDLTVALAIGGLLFWQRAVAAADPQPAGARRICGGKAVIALAGLAFIAINTVWLRVAHHYFDVEWDAFALFGSFVVQTGYAILWTVLALGLMILAHRRAQRTLWLTGAGFLGLVVVKLLLIDLSNIGGGERIVTFIAVGVLMLVVGYFAPLPPKAASLETSDIPVGES